MNKKRLDEIRARSEANLIRVEVGNYHNRLEDFLYAYRQDIPALLAYVDTLEEIEQIYIRSEEDSAREKGGLLERIGKLEVACREALEASELCGELDEELLREVLGDG